MIGIKSNFSQPTSLQNPKVFGDPESLKITDDAQAGAALALKIEYAVSPSLSSQGWNDIPGSSRVFGVVLIAGILGPFGDDNWISVFLHDEGIVYIPAPLFVLPPTTSSLHLSKHLFAALIAGTTLTTLIMPLIFSGRPTRCSGPIPTTIRQNFMFGAAFFSGKFLGMRRLSGSMIVSRL